MKVQSPFTHTNAIHVHIHRKRKIKLWWLLNQDLTLFCLTFPFVVILLLWGLSVGPCEWMLGQYLSLNCIPCIFKEWSLVKTGLVNKKLKLKWWWNEEKIRKLRLRYGRCNEDSQCMCNHNSRRKETVFRSNGWSFSKPTKGIRVHIWFQGFSKVTFLPMSHWNHRISKTKIGLKSIQRQKKPQWRITIRLWGKAKISREKNSL